MDYPRTPEIDRIACPWLVARFIDKEPRFLCVPSADVKRLAREQDAIPYGIPDVELGHDGDQCSFDALLKKYRLDDRVLQMLAAIAGLRSGRARRCARRLDDRRDRKR